MLKRAIRFLFKSLTDTTIHTSIATLDPSNLLEDKKIIVTGGSRGLGFEMAKKFKSEGAKVLITGRSKESLEKAADEIGCLYLQADISDINALEILIKRSEELLGGIDCLVNNAGISLHERNLDEVTPETWDLQFNTNLKGPFFLTKAFIKYLKDKKQRGNILFISSETGETCDMRPYGFTKAAINSMVRGLANLYKLDGIRINAIAPGITASDMTGLGKDGNFYAGTYGEGRFYLPEEIAEVATFLLSPVSNCISGQIITCNNAQTVNARWK